MAERWLIRAPAKQEAEEILGRTEEIYRRHRDHRAARLNQAPDILMLIERGGRTLGSLGLFEAAEGELLPTEHIFGVDLRARFPRSRLFEIGRLVAYQPGEGIVQAAIAAIMAALRNDGRETSLACTKPALYERVVGYGASVEKLPAQVIPERVPADYHGFFLEGKPPVAYLLHNDAKTARAMEGWGLELDFAEGATRRLAQRG